MIGLGSSSTLGIGLVIELRDQFTQNATKISKSMDSLQGNAKKTLNTSFNQMIGVGGVMSGAGIGIMMGMNAATKSATQFQKVLLNIKALGEMSNRDVLGLGNIAKTLGPKYGMSAISVAEGMEDLVKAGLKANEIPNVLEAILQTASAAGEKLEGETGVAARMTDMIMAWGFKSKDAARAGDVLAKAAIESTVSFADLSESMKYSQDIMKSLNFTFEESVAMMAVLGNSGIKASMAGTALGNAWREITIAASGGSKKKNLALHALGLSASDLKDTQGNLKRPLEILSMMKEHIKGFGGVDKQNLLTDLFGLRGKRAISPLMDMLIKGPNDKWLGKGLSGKGGMLDELLNNSAGSNMKILQEKMKGVAFQEQQMKANWDNIKISAGQAFMELKSSILPTINNLLVKLNGFLETSFGRNVIKGIAILGMLLTVVGGLFITVGLLGRMLMAGTVGFSTMGKAGLWVWNTLIARALTYLGVMKGIQATERLNKAGSIIDSVTGRVKVPAYKRLAKRGGSGILGSLLGNLGKFGSGVGGLASGLLRFIPIIGGVITVMMALSAMGISLRDQLNMVAGTIQYVIGSIINAIMGVLEIIPGVDFGGGGYFKRQMDLGVNAYNPNAKEWWGNSSYGYAESQARGNNMAPTLEKDYHHGNQNQGSTNVHIYVDGEKKISENIKNGQENEINAAYGLPN